MVGTTPLMSDDLPEVDEEPRLADVLSDVKVKLVLKIDQTVGDDLYYESAEYEIDADDFKWQPDLLKHLVTLPRGTTIDLYDSTNAKTATLSEDGVLTIDADKTGQATLYWKITVMKVTSLRSMGFGLVCDMGAYLSSVIQDTVGLFSNKGFGKAELFTSAGVSSGELSVFPAMKSTFGYRKMYAAGDECYITVCVYSEALVAKGNTPPCQVPNIQVDMVVDFKNKAEKPIYALAATAGALIGSEVVQYSVRKMLERFQLGNDLVSGLVKQISALGISITDIGIVLANAYYLRYSNKPDISVEDFLDLDKFVGLLKSLVSIMLANSKTLAIGVLSNILGRNMSNKTVGTVISLLGRGLSDYLIAVAAIAYANTIESYIYFA